MMTQKLEAVSLSDALAYIDQLMSRSRFSEALSILSNLDRQAPQNTDLLRRLAYCTAKEGNIAGGMVILNRIAARGDSAAGMLLDMMKIAQRLSPNSAQAQLDLERMRLSPYMDYPKTVTIETLASCNASCSFCVYPSMERQGTRMDDALLAKIITDLEAIPRDLRFRIAPFKVNEPFLDKRLISYCRTINKRLPNALLELFSNGSALTETALIGLAELTSVEFLWISLNHHRPDEYKAIMGLDLERTLARLDTLHHALESRLLSIPVRVSRVADRGPDDKAFTTFIASRFPRFQAFLIDRTDWAGQIERPAGYTPKQEGCSRWFEINIMATGKVALCCADGHGRHIIGDVATQSVLEIYNSPGFRQLRETIRVRRDADTPCRDCSL